MPKPASLQSSPQSQPAPATNKPGREATPVGAGMPLFLQRQDNDTGSPGFQLQPPSLLRPRASTPRIGLGLDLHLTLSPETERIIAEILAERMSPALIRPALETLDLSLPATAVAPAPAGAGAVNPFAAPALPAPRPIVPRGAGPATPRSADAGDVLRAITRVPAVDEMLTRLQTLALDRVRMDWSRLRTGERVGVVSTGVVIGAGVLAGVLSDPSARRLVWSQLNGRVWPVPGVDWLHLELRAGEGDFLLGGHVDVGRLLPPSWGFGPSSPQAFGAPPQPQPFVPGVQRKTSPELRVIEPGDVFEREADQVADLVMRRESRPERTVAESPPEVQRACAACQAGALCPQCAEEAGVASEAIRHPRPGRPLDASVRERIEPVLTADLSQVRVHEEASDRQTAAQLDARAFTHREHIWLGPGESSRNEALLAHEATHVVQQGAVQDLRAGNGAAAPAPDNGAQSGQSPRPDVDFLRLAAEPWRVNSSTFCSEARPRVAPAVQKAAAPNSRPGESSRAGLPLFLAGRAQPRQAVDHGAITAPDRLEEQEVAVAGLSATGKGPAATAVDFGVTLNGETEATFDGGTFATENVRVARGRGCEGCTGDDCASVSGDVVSQFSVATTVTLPSVDDFPDLTACQRRRVQDAITNVLSPHEQQHVRAFETYNGTVRERFSFTICRSEFDARIQAMHNATAAAREARARAKSAKLDPFNFQVDLNCTD